MALRSHLKWIVLGTTLLAVAGCGGGGGGGAALGSGGGSVSTSAPTRSAPTQNPSPAPPGSTSRNARPFEPAQIRSYYGFAALSSTGAGQTIALVEPLGSPTLAADLATFSSSFSLPAANLQVAYPSGNPTTTDPMWAMETSLDAEWAHAVAPGATLLVVVARSGSLPDLMAAVDYASANASVVSMSFGTAEFPTETQYDIHFTHPGVSYFAAAGDTSGAVLWPGVSPAVTSVGGTTLSLDASGTMTETAWTGGGGGTSQYEVEPAFQRAVQGGGARTVPDVAYNGNPATGYYVYDSTAVNGMTGWLEVGGTSAGAPQWAALTALVNAQRSSRESGLNAALYALGSPSADFNDILTGGVAKSGYDLLTGLGSPRSANLVPALISH